MIRFEYYGEVPKGLKENLLFRKRVLSVSRWSKVVQENVWARCRRDPIFFINVFCWTQDPRVEYPLTPTLPFITFPKQDEVIKEIVYAIMGRGDKKRGEYSTKRDVCIAKSRDQGATWLILSVYLWLWLFHPGSLIMVVSRNKEYVQSKSMKAMLPRVDDLIKRLPWWMLPKFDRTTSDTGCGFFNLDNGSSLEGEATTSEIGRGGRFTVIGIDEFAAFKPGTDYAVMDATQSATLCRIFNSTPRGPANEFYKVAHNEDIVQIRMHWSDDPRYAAGLYTSKDGKLRVIDKDHPFPDDYPFILDGKLRSPRYDYEWRRANNPTLMAQEFDLDFMSSGSPFYPVATIQGHKKAHAIEPLHVGEFMYDGDTGLDPRWKAVPNGHWKLWCDPGNLPKSLFGLGVDVSGGTGWSNSAISVVDRKSGKKVAEFSDNTIRPSRLARMVRAVAEFFSAPSGENALVIFEKQGPSREMAMTLLDDLGFYNVYMERNEQSVRKNEKDIPGYYINTESRRTLHSAYADALTQEKFINPSKGALEECLEYYWKDSISIEHSNERNKRDAKGSHGDICTADALANHICRIYDLTEEQPVEEDVENVFDIHWRLEQRAAERGRSRYDGMARLT